MPVSHRRTSLVMVQSKRYRLSCVCTQETDEIQFESYSRIEHVITGYWLHALRGKLSEFLRMLPRIEA